MVSVSMLSAVLQFVFSMRELEKYSIRHGSSNFYVSSLKVKCLMDHLFHQLRDLSALDWYHVSVGIILLIALVIALLLLKKIGKTGNMKLFSQKLTNEVFYLKNHTFGDVSMVDEYCKVGKQFHHKKQKIKRRITLIISTLSTVPFQKPSQALKITLSQTLIDI